MGHHRLGSLPRTRAWQEVDALLEGGAQSYQIANATIRAAEDGLRLAPKDRGVVHTVWLWLQLPAAAGSEDFPAALRDCGIRLYDPPTLMQLIGAFSDCVDAHLFNNHGRTDLGEMAQMAAAETLARVIGDRVTSLFETGPDEVHEALRQLRSVGHLGGFAKRFFARFTYKCLDYFLSRVLSNLVGEGRRFTTLAMQAEFCQALELDCLEAAGVLHRFAGEWASKETWEAGRISPDSAARFVGGAMSKLIRALKRGGADDGE